MPTPVGRRHDALALRSVGQANCKSARGLFRLSSKGIARNAKKNLLRVDPGSPRMEVKGVTRQPNRASVWLIGHPAGPEFRGTHDSGLKRSFLVQNPWTFQV